MTDILMAWPYSSAAIYTDMETNYHIALTHTHPH